MKKTLLATIASLVIAASVQAGYYFDSNPANVIFFNPGNLSYTGHFTLDGYNPALETITSATAVFSFIDTRYDLGESISIDISGDIFTHGSFNGSWTSPAYGIVNAMGTLDSTGILEYTVTLSSGYLTGTTLDNARLDAWTAPRGDGNSVPDAGATSVLLGLGVIGILGAKRRFASVA